MFILLVSLVIFDFVCFDNVVSIFDTFPQFPWQLHGVMRVEMRPLVPKIPLVGGLSIYFLKRPVSLLFTHGCPVWSIVQCFMRIVVTEAENVLYERWTAFKKFSKSTFDNIEDKVEDSLCSLMIILLCFIFSFCTLLWCKTHMCVFHLKKSDLI